VVTSAKSPLNGLLGLEGEEGEGDDGGEGDKGREVMAEEERGLPLLECDTRPEAGRGEVSGIICFFLYLSPTKKGKVGCCIYSGYFISKSTELVYLWGCGSTGTIF
jgi:hypothetical protein